jgi:hypothetical protein
VNISTALLILSLSLIGLVGCLVEEPSAGNGGGYIVPPAPIGPGSNMVDGYGNPAPELQQGATTDRMEWKASEETREWHAAASRADCDRIEKALKD